MNQDDEEMTGSPSRIQPRASIDRLRRSAEPEPSRDDFMRLERNELVPSIDPTVFETIVSQLTPETLSSYPGVLPLYQSLAASMKVDPRQILIGAGSDWLIRTCFDVFCESGDELVLPVPTYGMYEVYAQVAGASITAIPYDSDFELPMDELMAALARRPRLFGIANPNGALGHYMQEEQLEAALCVAREAETIVILDEAYVEYVDDAWLPRLEEFPNLILVRTFSKAHGLAGLRVGYAVGARRVIAWLSQLRPNVEINQVAVLAAKHLIDHPEITLGQVRRSLEGKELLAERLTGLGLEVRPGRANFVMVRLGEARPAVLSALSDARILVKDHVGGGVLDGWTRITVGPKSAMQQVIDVIGGAITHE